MNFNRRERAFYKKSSSIAFDKSAGAWCSPAPPGRNLAAKLTAWSFFLLRAANDAVRRSFIPYIDGLGLERGSC
jgi:hypothetical protein